MDHFSFIVGNQRGVFNLVGQRKKKMQYEKKQKTGCNSKKKSSGNFFPVRELQLHQKRRNDLFDKCMMQFTGFL